MEDKIVIELNKDQLKTLIFSLTHLQKNMTVPDLINDNELQEYLNNSVELFQLMIEKFNSQ